MLLVLAYIGSTLDYMPIESCLKVDMAGSCGGNIAGIEIKAARLSAIVRGAKCTYAKYLRSNLMGQYIVYADRPILFT